MKKKTSILGIITIAILAFQCSVQAAMIPAAPKLSANSYVLMDFETGAVLAESDADRQVEPASITKLMTAYVVFTELKEGHYKLEDMVTISEKAWREPGSRMFVEVNTQVSVENLIKGMVIQSGNDASVALAEFTAGSEDGFASLMNQYAQQLGMKNSHFANATGLPQEGHLVTAKDVGLLARAIIHDYPEYYPWFSVKEFTYNDIKQNNRNTLLWRNQGVDGLKTGHTSLAGYCLATSAVRGNQRLISVVMGSKSEKSRANDAMALLSHGFRFFETHKLYEAGQQLATTKVWKGTTDQLLLGTQQELVIVIPKGSFKELNAQIKYADQIIAPVEKGQKMGEASIQLEGKEIANIPVFALETVGEGGWWQRMKDSVYLWFESDDEAK